MSNQRGKCKDSNACTIAENFLCDVGLPHFARNGIFRERKMERKW